MDEPAEDMDDLFADVLADAAERIAAAGIAEDDGAALLRVVDAIADATVAALDKAAPAMVIDYAALRAGFEIRLRDPWEPAFSRFEALLTATREIGERFLKRHSEAVEQEGGRESFRFEALVRLHVRAACVASEIFALLRAGFADGALARWRTLHELTVVMAFLFEGDDDRAERYLLHNDVAIFLGLRDYQRFADRLGEEPLSSEDLATLKANRDVLVMRYGEPYGEEWGWAAAALKSGRPHFADIEKAAELDHWRPFGRLASQGIHAGPRGLFDIHARPNDQTLVSGASNYGLQVAGINACTSLTIATVILLGSRPGPEEIVLQRVIRRLGAAAEDAFDNAHEILEERVRRSTEPE